MPKSPENSSQNRITRLVTVGVGTIALTLTPFSTSAVRGQMLQLPELNWPQLNNSVRSNNRDKEVETSTVNLDGDRLFTIATPATVTAMGCCSRVPPSS